MGLSPERIKPVEADAFIVAEGNTEAPQWPGAEAPPGSETRARVRRVPQEPGRSSAFLVEEGDRDDSLNNDPARASRAREPGSPLAEGTRNQERKRGTAKRRQRSAAGRNAGSPSRS